MAYEIRMAGMADFRRIEEIYANARRFMAQTGNPNQWGKTNPPREQLLRDIANGELMVVENDTGIHGVFFFRIGPDPTYAVIRLGHWHRDAPYGTIHRIAGDGSHGILASAVAYGATRIDYLRIDTHRDNRVMQNALAKQGFVPCGIITIADGSERIAYDCSPDKRV